MSPCANRPIPPPLVCGITAVICLVATNALAQPDAVGAVQDVLSKPSDLAVAAILFDEQHVEESGLSICEFASRLPAPQRLEYLRAWVMPSESVVSFRVTVDFAAGLPAGSATNAEADVPKMIDHSRVVSPVLQLVQTAQQLQQIDSLRAQVNDRPLYSAQDVQDQITVGALIALADDSDPELDALLDNWLTRVRDDPTLLDLTADSVVLFAEQAVRSGRPNEAIRDLIVFVKHAYRAQYDRKAWIRHVVAAGTKLDRLAQSKDTSDSSLESDPPEGEPPSQWHMASLERAFEHGNAFPKPTWNLQRGSYRSLSNYGDEFLFYQSPLQGDFTIEGTGTGFEYRESQLMIGGIWAGLIYDHKHISIGNLRGERHRLPLTPASTDTNRYGFVRTQVKSQSGVATTVLNGRLVYQHPIGERAYPWVAIRTNYRVQGGVDDLRITGEPTIPDAISLVDSPDLLGWYDYFQPPGNRMDQLGTWQAQLVDQESDAPVLELVDARLKQLPRGSNVEHLLVYARPWFEDGDIEYEFWYQPDESMAHPAIGRHCFLISPNDVRRHMMTDGRYDRSGLRPDNAAPIDRPGNNPLPLRENQWNQMQIQRRGNQFELRLNGEPVGSHRVEPTDLQPRFGLFHFADQSALRVRKLKWSGTWPKSLPSISNQQLAGNLEETIAWTADNEGRWFRHRFDETSIASGHFTRVSGRYEDTVEPTPDGLVLKQVSEAGYRGALIAPAIDVGGDFDVIVAYDQFHCRAQQGKVGSIRLEVKTKSDDSDLAGVQRMQGRSGEHSVQCLRMATTDGNDRRSYFGSEPAECTAGRLMLCRRGTTIYYLAADNDSTRFRIVAKEDLPADDLLPNGITIGVQTQGPSGLTSVRFTELSVRAERMSGIAVIDPLVVIKSLNEQREQMPLAFQHDFTTTAPQDDDFYRWGDRRPWDQADRGLTVVAEGTDEWTSSGIALRHRLVDDFDITYQFDPINLPVPKVGKQTQVYLQLELLDPDRTQINTIMTLTNAKGVICQTQIRSRIDGSFNYRTDGDRPLEGVDRLRIARRGKDYHCIAGRSSQQDEILIGTISATAHPTNIVGVKMMLHTGGADRTAQIAIKNIQVHAATFLKVPPPSASAIPVAPAAAPQKPSQPKGLPTRIFESIRGIFN